LSEGATPVGRLRAVRIIAAIMAVSAVGFGVVTAVVGILVPAQAPHAFHNVIVASLLLILSAPPVIAVARAPEAAIRPLVMLAAVRPAAFRSAAWCGGVALAVMGGASLIIAGYASALASPWGWVALGGGLLFVAVAEWEVRRRGGEGS